MLEIENMGFGQGLVVDCERKKVKDTYKDFDLGNCTNDLTIY